MASHFCMENPCRTCGRGTAGMAWSWPSTSHTLSSWPPAPEFSDTGYVGKHRK